MIEAELTSSETPADETVDFQRGISDGFNERGSGVPSTSIKSKTLYCFACHRMEYHFNSLKGKSYHHLLIGLTFGLALIFGPYRCRCCGHRRMVRYNFLNPRYHFHRWKYAGKPKTTNATSNRSPDSTENRTDVEVEIDQTETDADPSESETGTSRRRRRHRKKKKLKSAPIIDLIGKDRRQRKDGDSTEPFTADEVDFSIDGLMGSFETEESRKQRLDQLEEERAQRDPFVGKKAKPRKKIKGKPKRRFAKKERLTGPTIYCFNCQQGNEHYHVYKGTGLYFFLFGISFGLFALFGPFRCSVCSKRRLFFANFLNPKYYIRHLLSQAGGYR